MEIIQLQKPSYCPLNYCFCATLVKYVILTGKFVEN